MEYYVLGVSFVFGTILGSFLNVVISRSPLLHVGRGISAFQGRSRCDHCGHVLRWFELLPVVSFFALRGQCARCSGKIPWRYTLVEICMGFLVFFLAYLFLINALVPISGLRAIILLLALFSLAGIFFFDLWHYLIPDSLLLIFGFSALGEAFFRLAQSSASQIVPESLVSLITSMFASFLFFFVIWYFSNGRAMGFGDVKLAPLIPLFLGVAGGIAALVVSFWIGALVSLALLAAKRKSMKDIIPFGPFMVVGTLLIFFYPETVYYLFPFLIF